MDDLIAGSGVAYRALANPSFMENLLRDIPSIRGQGLFHDTIEADPKMPATATRDIAAAGARLLPDRTWSGVDGVPVLGPEDLSPNDKARILSEVFGRPVRYERQSLDELATTLAGYGSGEAFVSGMVDMMRAKEQGLDERLARVRQYETRPSSSGPRGARHRPARDRSLRQQQWQQQAWRQ